MEGKQRTKDQDLTILTTDSETFLAFDGSFSSLHPTFYDYPTIVIICIEHSLHNQMRNVLMQNGNQ